MPIPDHCHVTRRSQIGLMAGGLLAVSATARGAQFGWLGFEKERGNGLIRKQVREVTQFTGIALGIDAQVVTRTGPSDSVTVEADENLLPLIETVVSGGTLEIRPVRRNLELQSRSLRITVQARRLEELSVGGSGSITAEALSGRKPRVEVGGSGSITVKSVSGDSVAVAIGGSGNATLGGTARSLSVAIGGSGEVQAGQLKADQVSVDIGGSGEARVWAVRSLAVAIAGSGDVQYWGDPQVSQSVVGSGTVKRLGSAPR